MVVVLVVSSGVVVVGCTAAVVDTNAGHFSQHRLVTKS